MKNAIGVEIPEYIEGLGKLEPFQGVWKSIIEDEVPSTNISRTLKAKKPHVSKIYLSSPFKRWRWCFDADNQNIRRDGNQGHYFGFFIFNFCS